MKTSTLDRAGLTLSALCIVHCLLLPLVTSALPIFGLLSENEAVHKILVLLAIVPAVSLFIGRLASPLALMARISGGVGISFLFAGAFVESLHDHETSLTVIGALCLAGAHLLGLFVNKPHTHEN